jgi:flagellar biosynthesis/type III secretory pathway protein FliH
LKALAEALEEALAEELEEALAATLEEEIAEALSESLEEALAEALEETYQSYSLPKIFIFEHFQLKNKLKKIFHIDADFFAF